MFIVIFNNNVFFSVPTPDKFDVFFSFRPNSWQGLMTVTHDKDSFENKREEVTSDNEMNEMKARTVQDKENYYLKAFLKSFFFR